MFKIALDAGHGLYTAGKRCMKAIDPKETREWKLNSRICEKIESILSGYEGYELIRVDDRTGKKDVALKKRTDLANSWGAHLYLSIHHNAGVNGGSGGGIVAYVYPKVDDATLEWRSALYKGAVKYTKLVGNRSTPLATADFHVCRETNMVAVLLELGYMDSTTDVPIILSEDFADKAAKGIAEVLVEKCGLTKKQAIEPKPEDDKISVIYQAWDDVHNVWLPNVTDLTDYAGILGNRICCVYANLSKGNIFYKVHLKGGKWLPEVKNREDYAGLYNKPIDALMMKTDTGKTIHYAVHLKKSNRWLPFVTGYNENDFDNGYAGIISQEIDGIKIYID